MGCIFFFWEIANFMMVIISPFRLVHTVLLVPQKRTLTGQWKDSVSLVSLPWLIHHSKWSFFRYFYSNFPPQIRIKYEDKKKNTDLRQRKKPDLNIESGFDRKFPLWKNRNIDLSELHHIYMIYGTPLEELNTYELIFIQQKFFFATAVALRK